MCCQLGAYMQIIQDRLRKMVGRYPMKLTPIFLMLKLYAALLEFQFQIIIFESLLLFQNDSTNRHENTAS